MKPGTVQLPGWIQPALCLLLALPLASTLYDWQQGYAADPADYLTRQSGWWALALLLATLCISPLARLCQRPRLLPLRRTLGLAAMGYATLHLGVYLQLSGLQAAILLDDIRHSPYIVAGAAAWLMLLPLALTSTRGWMRRLGRNWSRLHRLIYPAAITACIHYYWLTKSDLRSPLLFGAILALLLAWRLQRRYRA